MKRHLAEARAAELLATALIDTVQHSIAAQEAFPFRQLAAKFERRMIRAIRASVRAARAVLSHRQIEFALQVLSPSMLEAALLPFTGRLEQELQPRLVTLLATLYLEAQALAIRQLTPPKKTRRSKRRGAADVPTVTLDAYAEAEAWALQYAATLVQGLTQESRDAIRLLVARAFSEGYPPSDLATLIIEGTLIGLTERQTAAVLNLRNQLLNKPGRVVYAGNRKIKVPEQGASPEQVVRWSTRYANDLLRARATNIARTETIETATRGQARVWDKAKAAGLLKANQGRRWTAAPDETTCKICKELDGQVVGLQQPFQSSFVGPVLMPPAHNLCRCSVVLAILPPTGVAYG